MRGRFLIDSAVDVIKLEAKMEKMELMKDLSVSRQQRRNPEVILFGVDSNLPDGEVVLAILKQNDALQSEPLEL